jgi:hypothetical protein
MNYSSCAAAPACTATAPVHFPAAVAGGIALHSKHVLQAVPVSCISVSMPCQCLGYQLGTVTVTGLAKPSNPHGMPEATGVSELHMGRGAKS